MGRRAAVSCLPGPMEFIKRKKKKEPDQTDSKEENSARLKSAAGLKSHIRMVEFPAGAGAAAPAWRCALGLLIDRHLAGDIISPLFPRPSAKMPLQAVDLCALMSCR